MENEELKNVSVVIAGRKYPLKVDASGVDEIREIERELNDMILDYKSAYKDKDIQDHISMVLLMYAFEMRKSKQNIVGPETIKKVNALDMYLDGLLK